MTLYACAKKISKSNLENLDRELDCTWFFLPFFFLFWASIFLKAENNNRNRKIHSMLKTEKFWGVRRVGSWVHRTDWTIQISFVQDARQKQRPKQECVQTTDPKPGFWSRTLVTIEMEPSFKKAMTTSKPLKAWISLWRWLDPETEARADGEATSMLQRERNMSLKWMTRAWEGITLMFWVLNSIPRYTEDWNGRSNSFPGRSGTPALKPVRQLPLSEWDTVPNSAPVSTNCRGSSKSDTCTSRPEY